MAEKFESSDHTIAKLTDQVDQAANHTKSYANIVCQSQTIQREVKEITIKITAKQDNKHTFLINKNSKAMPFLTTKRLFVLTQISKT